MLPWSDIAGDPASGLLLIGDHASNHVPNDIELGISPALLETHIAIDIGVARLGEALCRATRCPGILGAVSRLVIDLNREEDRAGLIPDTSDGWSIPGNAALDAAARAARVEQWWWPYHREIGRRITADAPELLISLHSFTPALESRPDLLRPWEIGILYNRDERAARIALRLLAESRVIAGDNEPYSGRVLNATMNAHGEANGIKYLGIEVRQNLIDDPKSVARWAQIIAPIIVRTLEKLRRG